MVIYVCNTLIFIGKDFQKNLFLFKATLHFSCYPFSGKAAIDFEKMQQRKAATPIMWQIMSWDPTLTMSQKLRLRNTTNNVAKFKASTVDSSKSSSCIKSPRYFLRSLLKKRPMEFLYVIPDLDKLWMNKLQLFCRRKI